MIRICKYMLLYGILLTAAACTRFSNRGTADRPYISFANKTDLGIEKVELTDSSTILYAVSHGYPGSRVELTDSSCITADGKEYLICGAENILLNEMNVVPDSGVMHFAMVFPAIPASATSIDFISGRYIFNGIDLTGKLDFTANQKAVPAELKTAAENTAMPEIVMKYDSVTVNIHILGYDPSMGKFSWGLNTAHGTINDDSGVQPDDNGDTRFKFALAAPATLYFYPTGNLQLSAFVHLSPGDNIDLYLDSNYISVVNAATRDGKNYSNLPEGYRSWFGNGYYNNYDLMGTARHKSYRMRLENGSYPIYRLSGDEYTRYVIDNYKAYCDSVSESSLPEMIKARNLAALQSELIRAVNEYRYFAGSSFRAVNKDFRGGMPADSMRLELSDENVRSIGELIDFNNPMLLMEFNPASMANTSVWNNANIDCGLLKAMSAYKYAYEMADNAELTDEVLEDLRAINPEFAKDVEAHNRYMTRRLPELKAKYASAPDVAPEKMLEEIVKPYKGKVVMVDFWNTWCSPCRASIAETEPEKSGDLSSDDIVWIYIADTTSPLRTYIDMIGGIKGIHYRLEKDVKDVIRQQLKVDGIPYYVLVDKKGKIAGRPDLRDHELFKKTLLEEVAK